MIAPAREGAQVLPIHDWTRVGPGVFHDIHNVWIGERRNVFNGGLLPGRYYAMSEQHAGKYMVDVLTLHAHPPPELPHLPLGGVVVAEVPPRKSPGDFRGG
jgi:hypothetical protein